MKDIIWRDKLEFLNPTVQSGVNLTVRLGYKWYEKFHRDKITEVFIYDTDTQQVICEARLLKVEIWKFDHIPFEYLELEHDVNCRTPEGLEEAMKKAYGTKFNPGMDVSVVFFELDR